MLFSLTSGCARYIWHDLVLKSSKAASSLLNIDECGRRIAVKALYVMLQLLKRLTCDSLITSRYGQHLASHILNNELPRSFRGLMRLNTSSK